MIAALQIRVDDDLGTWEREADAFHTLHRASARPDPFTTLAFLRTYLDHDELAETIGRDIRLVSFREGERLVGYVALRRTVQRMGPGGLVRCGRVDFAVTRDHERPHIVSRPEDADRLADALIRHLRADRSWGLVEFQGQASDSALRLAAHRAAAPLLWARDVEMPAYHELDLTRFADTAAYFAALSKRMRSNVSRQARRLFASGAVDVVTVSGPAVTSMLPAYLDLEDRSWKHGTDVAVGRHHERVRFHQALLGGNVDLDPQFVGIVRDGILIAAMLWSHADYAGHAAWAHEMAYDSAHEELGPGQLLLLLATGEAIAVGARRFHFFQQHGYYKHRWLAEETPAVNVQLIRQPGVFAARGRLGDAVRSRRGGEPSGTEAAGHPGTPGTDDANAAGHHAGCIRQPAAHRIAAQRSADLMTRAMRTVASSARVHSGRRAAEVIPFPLG